MAITSVLRRAVDSITADNWTVALEEIRAASAAFQYGKAHGLTAEEVRIGEFDC